MHPMEHSHMPTATSGQVGETEALARILRGVVPVAGWHVTSAAGSPAHSRTRGTALHRCNGEQKRTARILCQEEEPPAGAPGGFATAEQKAMPKKKRIIKRRGKAGQVPKRKKEMNWDRIQKAANQNAVGRERLQEMQKQSGIAMQLFKALQKNKKTEREKMIEEDPNAGVMPEVVSDRMLGRIGTLASIPVLLAFGVLYGFYYYSTQGAIDVPANYVAYATILLLVTSFAGITFGVLTTQLDEDGEQTFLGIENVKKNWYSMRGIEEERTGQAQEDKNKRMAEEAGIVTTPEQADAVRERLKGEIKK